MPLVYMFQQDNDGKHTDQINKDWLIWNISQQLRTPPHSPDLNLIEHWLEILKKTGWRVGIALAFYAQGCGLVVEVDNRIPECQFGFRKGRSTLHAISYLIEQIENTLRHPGKKYHVVFVDYCKAFDLINRETLIRKLSNMIGESHALTTIIADILSCNYIQISDEITLSNKIIQTNGVLQGDPISPVLFNIMTTDITKITEDTTASMIMYADDMAIGSSNIEELQQVLNKLVRWAEENSLQINHQKTKQMNFRNGGKQRKKDTLTLQNEPLEVVQKFKYLGVTLQTTLKSYRIHIQERAAAAIKAMYNIKNLQQLETKMAMTLFRSAIAPIATYGLNIIWGNLTVSDMGKIERVNSSFMKRVLGVGRTTLSRLTYELMKERFFIEDIRTQLCMPNTPAYEKALEVLRGKKNAIWSEFYITDAMTTRDWANTNYELRHIVTRYAVHGFHHKICTTKRYHEPNDECVCELCQKPCGRYHVENCRESKTSLTNFCKD
ncbi:hypothetical protein ANN_01196 [Periplaneta americana]|uniref:Reverse transcriptase domain-containing protein n=1 Tax=Periplaneta americana TaxID=6978 RepID=A0ABQ8TVT1_PERAM|nr:hypothetical protein ANN_01196 [Periplaneta americana]